MAEDKKDDKKKEEPAAAEEKTKGPEKPKSQTPLLMGIIVAVILLNAIIAFVLIRATKPQTTEEKLVAEKVDSAMVEMKHGEGALLEPTIEVVVNVAQTDAQRFLKVVVALEYEVEKYPKFGEGGGEGEGKGGPNIKKWVPKFKNVLIDQLSTLTLMELNEPEVKEKVRKNFLREVNMLVPAQEVQFCEVLLEQFIIQ